MMQQLVGRGAIVTGAASGIGLGISRTLARAGVNVAMLDIDAASLDKARAEVAKLGGRAIAYRVDVSDRTDVAHAAERIATSLGRVHFVFNNAGVEIGGRTLAQVSDADWDWLIGVNIHGVLNGIRHFVPLLTSHRDGGHIVNTASLAGFHVNADFKLGPYAMTKYAVVALTEALEQDFKDTNIGVSLLCPGAVNTRIADSARNRPARFGGPSELQRNAALREALARGLSGDEVGERVMRGIRDREFYIFTHAEPRRWFSARFGRILASFDRIQRRPEL